ncbi:MAG: hypothetical protein KGZ40_00975 [Clostridiales bacterium]|nr:hypothetical protein [Clostridiales bacterium]
MRVRLFLTLALGCLMLVSGVAVAFASPDTEGQEATTVIGADGASRWWYQDLRDPARKTEGGYRAFDATATATHPSGAGFDIYGTNPHGGYDSTSNKCKVCHAVHRAEGAYYLLRANSQDDACNYCHIGNSARSRKIVYDSSGAQGIYTTNGHTIGASSIIPDSSVRQWLTDTTISTVDASMNTTSTTIQVRRYEERRNAMFRFTRDHGNFGHGGFGDWARVGPNALTCMSCHQVHNAQELVWRTADAPAGYKLLRSSPSGSVNDQAMMVGRAGGTVTTAEIIDVPTTDLTAANTGLPDTVWTDWRQAGRYHNGVFVAVDPQLDPAQVTSRALSVWCADCHNLNIGSSSAVPSQFGGEMHGDRTHPVPYTGTSSGGPAQCYSCHRADMPLTPANSVGGPDATCNQCHLGTVGYATMRTAAENAGNWALYDFPHAGPANDFKMLGRWTSSMDATGWATPSQVGTLSAGNLDAVCLRCHTGVGVNH